MGLSHEGREAAYGGFDGSVSVATSAGLRILSGHLRSPKPVGIIPGGDLVVIALRLR